MAENMEQQKWYSLTEEEVAANLKVDPKVGLSSAEAEARLKAVRSKSNLRKRKRNQVGRHFCASIKISCRCFYWVQL